jgi:hypothetical protein
MAEPDPTGNDVSAETYECTECGYEVESTEHLPPVSRWVSRCQ